MTQRQATEFQSKKQNCFLLLFFVFQKNKISPSEFFGFATILVWLKKIRSRRKKKDLDKRNL